MHCKLQNKISLSFCLSNHAYINCSRACTLKLHDRFAVAVVQNGIIVDRIPQNISAVTACFLSSCYGSIHCEVTGSRCYSKDLPQGGLEIPCILVFEGDEKAFVKTE